MRLFLRIRTALRVAAVDAVNQALLVQGELNPQVIKSLTRNAGVAASLGGLAMRTRPKGLGSHLTSSPILRAMQDTGHHGDSPVLGDAITGVSRADTAIVTESVAPYIQKLQLQLQDCWLV
jgi:hypothetical protein